MIEFWQDLTTTEFEGLDPMSTLALLPVAAIEQHGPHLPLSTDLIINRGIVHEAITRLAPGVRVLVLPVPVRLAFSRNCYWRFGRTSDAVSHGQVCGSLLF
jgi:creatinine amidohydrolase/Fe(II)-dependent formamide hydrolase-like protein